MKRATVLPLLLIFLSPIFAQEETLLLNAESAVLVGIDSKQVLFEKNGERICPPASMTKLVTAYTAMRLWENRGWDLDRRFLVPPAADFRAAPPHSSLMFLQSGQIVSLKELLCGLMIPSGNDAAVAVALLTVGSVEAFVLEMNRTMESLGFGNCQFADASGYSPQNRIRLRLFAAKPNLSAGIRVFLHRTDSKISRYCGNGLAALFHVSAAAQPQRNSRCLRLCPADEP